MFLSYWTLGVALSLSLVAAWYSIVGLTAIFATAVIPIIIMGTILEVAKVSVTVWLHEYWNQCRLAMKVYLVPAVVLLMVITSMGIFGFLSKAHLDQAVPTGDVAAQVSLFDEKIKTQRDNVEAARSALRQMDAAVDQTLSRSADEKGADRAAQLRRQQGAERNRLQADIARAQTEIARLNDQRAPVAAELRKVEAEVGPVKYIAALIYGDNPDANLLERAVRWVIIMLVIVFDPLAIMMVLASTESLKWEREKRAHEEQVRQDRIDQRIDHDLDPPSGTGYINSPWPFPPEDKPVQQDDIDLANDILANEPRDIDVDRALDTLEEPDSQPAEPKVVYQVLDDADDEIPPDKTSFREIDPEEVESESATTAEEKLAMQIWKAANPNDTLKRQRFLLEHGMIDHLPWQELKAVPDNLQAGEMTGFGIKFPEMANKGDMFLRVDNIPSRLYKYNGSRWIEVDKKLSSQYIYDDAYLDYLIAKLESGEYDPDLLSDEERDQIEKRLKNI